MDVLAGIAAATEAIKIAKSLHGLDKQYDEATFRLRIAELVNSLSDAKLALSEAKDMIAELDKEISLLKRNFEASGKLVVGDGDYRFFADADGNPLGYPVCPSCESLCGRLIQLKQETSFLRGKCPACKELFQPVTCYLPKASAFRTVADEEAFKGKQQTKRMHENLSRMGRNLA
jgi:phage FluMu protein Com